MGEEEQERDAARARRHELEEVERRRVGVVEVLEDVEDRPRAGERGEHVEDGDVHGALLLLALLEDLGRAAEVEERREHRRDAPRGGLGEAELLQLRLEADAGILRRRLEPELDQEWLDEAGVGALVDPRERPAHDARRVRGARAVPLGRGEAEELAHEAALADAGLSGDDDDLASAEARRLEREVEAGELHPAADEGRADVDPQPIVPALPGQRVGHDRPLLPAQLDGADLAEGELALREAERLVGDVDLARGRRGLEPRGRVHRVAHDAVLGDGPHLPGDDEAGVDADAQAELDGAVALHPRRVVREPALHAERAAERALRVVLVGHGSAEDDEDGVADELLDGPVVAERLLGEILEDLRDGLLEDLGVQLLGERVKPTKSAKRTVTRRRSW